MENIKKISGIKRLFIALSIIWLVVCFFLGLGNGYLSDDMGMGFQFSDFFLTFIPVSAPVWLGWIIYWVIKGFKK